MRVKQQYEDVVGRIKEAQTNQKIKTFFIGHMREQAQSILTVKKVVLCGATPFAQSVIRNRDLLFQDDVELIIEDFDRDELTDYGDCIYILCSRPNISKHMNTLRKVKNAKVISYQLLLVLEPRLSSQPYAYTYDKIEKQIDDIIEHIQEYSHIYESLQDDKSKELFMKMILYRLTYDCKMHEDNATKYAHYFDEDIFSLGNEEIFVDCGGYNGDTLEVVKNLTGNNYKKYYLFEPDKELISIAKQKGDDRDVFINKGVWNCETTLYFKQQTAAGNGTFVAEKSGGNNILEVSVTNLDSVVEKASFIKMDVEGSELMALEGSKDLIRRCLPVMAICVYHKYEDYRELFSFIDQLGKYKVYLRAEMDNIDTGLYFLCIPER